MTESVDVVGAIEAVRQAFTPISPDAFVKEIERDIGQVKDLEAFCHEALGVTDELSDLFSAERREERTIEARLHKLDELDEQIMQEQEGTKLVRTVSQMVINASVNGPYAHPKPDETPAQKEHRVMQLSRVTYSGLEQACKRLIKMYEGALERLRGDTD